MKPQKALKVLDPSFMPSIDTYCLNWKKSGFSKNSITQTAGLRLPSVEGCPVGRGLNFHTLW